MSADENFSTEDQYNSNQKNSESKHSEESISFQADECPKTSINMAKNEEEKIARAIGLAQETSGSKDTETSNEVKAPKTEDIEVQTNDSYESDEESEGYKRMFLLLKISKNFRLLLNKRKRGKYKA